MAALTRTQILAKAVINLQNITIFGYQNADMDSFCDEGLVEISKIIPYIFTDTIASVGTKYLDGATLIPTLLPGNPIIKAEYPDDTFSNVSVMGNTIELLDIGAPASGEDVTLYCRGIHTVTDSASTLSPAMEVVLAKWIAGLAAVSMSHALISKATAGGQNMNVLAKAWGRDKIAEAEKLLRSLSVPSSREF
jgi:hypothetical protein